MEVTESAAVRLQVARQSNPTQGNQPTRSAPFVALTGASNPQHGSNPDPTAVSFSWQSGVRRGLDEQRR